MDVLGQIGNGRRYEDLLPDAVTYNVGNTMVRVLGLSALIRTKEEAGREKDLAVWGFFARLYWSPGRLDLPLIMLRSVVQLYPSPSFNVFLAMQRRRPGKP